MTDIAEQLRSVSFRDPQYALYRRAAEEIERLRREADLSAKTMKTDALSILYTYRDLQPEEDESWESWYYAAFDLACMKLQELSATSSLTE